jgi:hypothetical protein
LQYLFAPDADSSVEAFVVRYREITPNDLPIAPHESTILGKLVWPLRHAKGSYALGNYLGCIALCGMVGEMVAILLWDICKVKLGGPDPATAKDQEDLFGRPFEKLGQERRVRVLRRLSLIEDEAQAVFDRLRHTRNRYLHFLSQPHDDVASDARRAFADALIVTHLVLGVKGLAGGAVTLRPELMSYLHEKAILTEVVPNPQTPPNPETQ